jgi:membrane protein involved in colicin uptake
VADAIGAGAATRVAAAVAGLDRPSPQPAAARATARPAATPSNERLAEANAVDLIRRPLSAGSGAARKGRLN